MEMSQYKEKECSETGVRDNWGGVMDDEHMEPGREELEGKSR